MESANHKESGKKSTGKKKTLDKRKIRSAASKFGATASSPSGFQRLASGAGAESESVAKTSVAGRECGEAMKAAGRRACGVLSKDTSE